METVLANIAGPDLIIVAVIVLVLFGGAAIPRFAKGLGQAKNEFEKAQTEPPKAEAPAQEPKPETPKTEI